MAQIFETYRELLDCVKAKNKEVEVMGSAPDGAPIVAVRSGGDKTPAIFITAGSHSTEQAGVTAAVELIDELDTEHQVYTIPTRDPLGMNGYAYALKQGLSEDVDFDSFEELEAILRDRGELHYEKDETFLVLIGEYGYANYNILGRMGDAPAESIEPFKGRRIFIPTRKGGVEGADHFKRAYTLIMGPDGELLHINRFHDTQWAPVEPRCARNLMKRINPGISFDIHESMGIGDRFWLSARTQQDEEGQKWEERAARETIQAIADLGVELAREEEDDPASFFTRSERAVYWLDASKRGEGLNLMDFAAVHYGMAFGTEMGMFGSFEQRVMLGKLTVQSAVRVFEERYK